jgi:hypothetical protein
MLLDVCRIWGRQTTKGVGPKIETKEKTDAIHDADDPNVYRGNRKLDPSFVPDPKKLEEMARFNEELARPSKSSR